MENNKKYKKAISLEGAIFSALFILFFYFLGSKMGVVNMFNTLMKTAHDLLLNTVFFIMGIAVLAGAIAALFSEFGVVSVVNKVLSPLMKPLYDLPGAATLGILTTYLSDNPAIITLAQDKGFKRYFKKYQIPALTNLGTAFGMGLIVTTFMIAQKSPIGESFIGPALIGNLGAVVGSMVSVRIMLHFTKKEYGTEAMALETKSDDGVDLINYREIREGSVGGRFLEAMLEGGKSGVEMGVAIIPGVVIICTLVLMLTKGPGAAGYTGAAYEGVPVLPWIGDKLGFILNPLLGFKNSQAIAFPVTALGAVGAAIGLVPEFLKNNLIGGNEIAVFTAMGMCWSGYLSTHVAMMDSLDCRQLTGKAILSHTVGGLCAGIFAHFLYVLIF
ncbi:membrane protein [Clostridium sp. KNHs214]|uniref:CD0519/CD1768 family membrane protein n=1 Tax=Clostridium sp. KNHs214 TaxID=1540257 RepID=UPI00054FF6AA|nr:membrane protein [Clostridium sp. KNHs214]